MSSFNYTDNYTGFNDLINRADFLTEAKIGKAHPSFKGLAGRIKKDPRSGGKGFPRDARMLIKTVLYNVDIFNDKDLATLKAAGVEASSQYRETLEALLDKYEDVIKSKAGKIADKLEDEFERFVNDQALMVGADRKEAYLAKKEAKDAADAFEKEIQGGGDVVDAVDDAVGELEQGTADAFKGLQDAVKRAKEDPTTFVEIVLKDIDKAEDVKALVAQYANKDGVEVIDNPPTVEFSADADSPLANAVKRHGEDKVGAAIRRDVAKIADNAVVVMAPLLSKEEDYEILDAPNEYEEGINEVEDEDNEFDDFDIGPQSDENVPDDYEEVLKAMVTKDKEEFAKNMIEDEEDKDFDDEQRDQDPLRHSGDLKKLTYSVGSVGGQHGQIMHRGKTFDSLEDACNHAGVDVQDCISGEWDDMGDGTKEYGVDEDTVIIMHVDKAEDEERITDVFYKNVDKIEQDINNGMTFKESMISNKVDRSHWKDLLDIYTEYMEDKTEGPFETGFEDEEGGKRLKELEIAGHRYEVGVDDPNDDGIVIDIEKNKNGYTITGAVYSDPMDYYEDPNDMKEGYRYAIDQDGKYIGAPEDEERINEAIKMQPHLEVSKTSTAVYLTEQKQSDKRNKKAGVKNQSFKERYKPKTHWQLEELRRYGL